MGDERRFTRPSAEMLGSEWRCNCKASDYPRSRGRCWHLAAVQAGIVGKPRCRASVIAPAPETGDEANDYGFTSPEYRSDFGFEAPREAW